MSDSQAKRVGERIRSIRVLKGLSQSDLGERVGLSADRIQKYENGARKPKTELLRQIAAALGVSEIALSDPLATEPMGVMYFMFELEKEYGLSVEQTNGLPILSFSGEKASLINMRLTSWAIEREYIKNRMLAASSADEIDKVKKEYELWKANFADRYKDSWESVSNELKARAIKEKIEILQDELNSLGTF